MRVGLFIPCYIDQFYPKVGIATLQLLKKLGVDVEYPLNQTCCGQPLANSGFESYTKKVGELFKQNFDKYDYIVSPSGSCVFHVRNHFNAANKISGVENFRENTFELCDFITNVLGNLDIDAVFNKKVGLHQSCHGLRGLKLGRSSETVGPPYSIVNNLLEKVSGIQLMPLGRTDECCGFGGTFAIAEEAISIKMAKDRLKDHLDHGVEVITSTDMSCLMHLHGVAVRRKLNIEMVHVAEILNSK